MIEINRYFPAANVDYRKNPFIEAWPPLDRDAISALMISKIEFSPAERTHSPDLRIQYAHRLMDFFLPLDPQVDFNQKLWALICAGYKARDPSRSSTTASFDQLCDSIAQDRIAPSEVAHFRDSIWTAFLIGTPGTGKTSTPIALLRRLAGDLLHHMQWGELFQSLFVHVQAPKRGRGKSLAEAVYGKLKAEAQKVGLPLPYVTGKKPKTLHEFEEAIDVFVRKLNLGLLILDELQHLYAGTGDMDQDAMKFLTGFVSRLNIPVLFVGTWECAALLGLEMRLGRRVTGPTTSVFRRMQFDEDFGVFVQTLLNYQFTTKVVETTPEMVERIYYHTQGVADLVVKLTVMCQVEAILTGDEEITVALIDEIGSNHMGIIAPAIRMMRDGQREEDPVLWDLEPVDFERYLIEFTAKLKLNGGRANARAARRVVQAQATTGAVAASLEATGTVDSEQALALAAAAVARKPDAPAVEHVSEILSDAAKASKGPKPTRSKSERKQAEVDAQFSALDSKDVRKVVYLATRREGSIADALESAGHLCPLLEDAPY
jgi:AAA domain